MKTVFADTFYYLALLNLADNRHSQALAYTAAFNGCMVTTAWILVELADALANSLSRPAFLEPV